MAPAPQARPRLTGERKAAIMVLLLGEQVAGELFKHMSRRDVARIAKEVAQLGPIAPEVAERVLQEYYLEALHAPENQGGPEVARRILAQASISEEIVDQLVGRQAAAQEDILGPLLEAPPDVLARALEDEHPQTTALVLLHLPPRRAAKLLEALPESARGETVLRTATLRQVRGGVLGEVATSLQERLAACKGQNAQGGLERTVAILGSMPRPQAKRVLDELEGHHPTEVHELRARLFTFDSLVNADDRGMQDLLRSVDASRLGLALTGAPPAVVERFMANLSERAASMLKEEMGYVGTPNPADQAAARKEILDQALKLEEEGRLTFAQADGGEDDV